MWAAMSGWLFCLGLLLNYTVVSITLCRRVIGPRCHNTKKKGRARKEEYKLNIVVLLLLLLQPRLIPPRALGFLVLKKRNSRTTEQHLRFEIRENGHHHHHNLDDKKERKKKHGSLVVVGRV
jgi:hypothetical protein